MTTLLLSEVFPPRPGGSGRWFWEIYRRLARDDYVLSVGQSRGQAAFDANHDLQIQRLPLAMSQWGILSVRGARDYWSNVCRLRRLIKQHRISQIHCGRCLPEGVMCLALKKLIGTPYACFVHGEDVGTAVNSREHAFLVRQVLANAEYCIANSHNTSNLIRSRWQLPADRVRILHPGVDTKQFSPALRSDSLRSELGWRNRTVILSVGRLQRRKGHDILIQALPAIKQQVPDVLYSIVGDGEERAFLEQSARDLQVLEHVQFRGETSDGELAKCYQQCNIFALPNREINGDIEGFGMVLLEAQACGRPVIAGQSGGTAETMRVDHTGKIVDCTHPDELARTLIHLLRDPDLCDTMGRAAREWAVNRFDWDALAIQAERLFQEERMRRYKAT